MVEFRVIDPVREAENRERYKKWLANLIAERRENAAQLERFIRLFRKCLPAEYLAELQTHLYGVCESLTEMGQELASLQAPHTTTII